MGVPGVCTELSMLCFAAACCYCCVISTSLCLMIHVYCVRPNVVAAAVHGGKMT